MENKQDQSEPFPASDSVSLVNIGTGPATNVRILWEYPVEEFAEVFNEVWRTGHKDLSLNKFANSFFEFKSSDKTNFAFNAAIGVQARQDYVLPSATIHQPTRVRVPFAFVVLCSLCTLLPFADSTESDWQAALEKVCTIRMRLKYCDLANEEYERTFQCKFMFFSFSQDHLNGEITFDGVSEVSA